MAVSNIPPIGEFDRQRPDRWPTYEARFKHFLVASKIESESCKRSCFFSMCGADTYETAQDLLLPDDVETASLADILAALKKHFAPAPSSLAKRHAFYKRDQGPAETVADFVAALRAIAKHCQFENLEIALRDRLVCGLKDTAAQRRLFKQTTLTFKDALEEAIASESAQANVASLHANTHARPEASRAREVHCMGNHTEEEEEVEPPSNPEGVLQVSRVPKEPTYRRAPGLHHSTNPPPTRSPCDGCGALHRRLDCPFRRAICRLCGRVGHLAKVCRTSRARQQPAYAALDYSKGDNVRCISHVAPSLSPRVQKLTVTVKVQGRLLAMEVDSGSAYSLLSADAYWAIPRTSRPALRRLDRSLTDYQGTCIPVLGSGLFEIQYRGFCGPLRMVVVQGSRTNLLGLEWFQPLGIAIMGVNCIGPTGVDQVCAQFPRVFGTELGKYTGPPVKFQFDPEVKPIRLKPRRVPFALKDKIEAELDKLVAQGILEPVDSATWETPIVPVLKQNGDVRICGDYKCTINKAVRGSAYPVPVVSHLLASLKGGKIFAKIDLAQAYQQLPVDALAAEAQTIVTHKGAFKVHRLQFGVNAAPGIFQGLMESLLKDIQGAVPYFDDILVVATDQEDLQHKLARVLGQLDKAGLRVKREKCMFGVPEVEFLGFVISAGGVRPAPSKVRAILEAPRPRGKTELQAFLGLVNFYHQFLPRKAAIAEPLHRLLDKNASWLWTTEHQQAFNSVKKLLCSPPVLHHFDDHKRVILVCDASPVGVGAVLCQPNEQGVEVPIAFYSRTLSSAERNYAQIDREALAIIAGVRKFHDFVYGRAFEIITDHKPLLGIFVTGKPTPQIMSPRMLRWSVFLGAYDFTLTHRPGVKLGNADALSRCPLPEQGPDPCPVYSTCLIEALSDLPISIRDIAKLTRTDPVLSKVLMWVGHGWPNHLDTPDIRPFWSKRTELSLHKGCILWGSRVIIPGKLQQRVLDLLHSCHPGMVRMKALARSYVWWPNLDKGIEDRVNSCPECQANRPEVPSAEPREWEPARGPWSRLHVDFAGPFMGKTFLLVIDAYSKWLEVFPMKTTTAGVVVKKLRHLFTTHGIPDMVVSDNGPPFTSEEFRNFLERNAIRQVTSAPFHPASNGQAERVVRTTKAALWKMGPGDFNTKLDQFLLSYRVTPSTVHGRTPAEMLMHRRPVTLLDKLNPLRVGNEEHWAPSIPKRELADSDPVYVRNYARGPTWVEGSILERTGPVSYRVRTADGQVWRRHLDQVRYNPNGQPSTLAQPDVEPEPEQGTHPEQDSSQENDHRDSGTIPADTTPPGSVTPGTPLQGSPAAEPSTSRGQGSPTAEPCTPRRSTRTSRPPAYLKDYVTYVTY